MTQIHCHTHAHTEFSLLDGVGRIADIMERAKEIGHEVVCMTDHGSVRGIYKFHMAAKEAGLKPVYGCELYMTEDMSSKSLPGDLLDQANKMKGKVRTEFVRTKEAELGIRETWHMCVFAKNQIGLTNLFKLTSSGWVNGYYNGKPRVDWAELEKFREGLIASTACTNGVLARFILAQQMDRAVTHLRRLIDLFGDDLYIEIMPNAIKEQDHANQILVKLAHQYGVKLIATNDVHYLRPGDHRLQEVLLCIQTKDYLSNPNRFKFDTEDFWFRTSDEMAAAFKLNHPWLDDRVRIDAMVNTMLLADSCDAKLVLDRFRVLLPHIDVPEGESDKSHLTQLCLHGWDWRQIPRRIEEYATRRGITVDEGYEVYSKRLSTEMSAVFGAHFERYFLIVWDLYKWARSQGVMVGPGRGSAAGSMMAFLLGITSIDPIEHDLLFERFISPGRIDLPDIDMDFEDKRRDEVISYMRHKYGEQNSSMIGTVVTLKGKQCLRDVSRVLGVPSYRVSQVTNSIVERSSGDERASQTVEDSFKEFKVCQEFNADYPDVLKYVMALEGQARQKGIHAAGIVLSPQRLDELVPLEVQKNDKDELVPVTAVDFWGTTDMGLLKLDVLGLRNLSVIKDALKAIKERHGVDVDLEAMQLGDQKVFDAFSRREYIGIFQYDTTSMFNLAEGIKFDHFEDVTAMNALNRPGTARSGLATKYVERKNGKQWNRIHDIYDDITRATYGVIVYQEQVINIFKRIGGYEPGTADSLRKKIAKKFGVEVMTKERSKFKEGSRNVGMTDQDAEDLFDSIVFFGSYGFNKSHAAAYAAVSYWEMWLKVYYPIEFMWALLNNEPNQDTLSRFVREAERLGIPVMKPDVNYSQRDFVIVGDSIAFAFSKVKWVSDRAIASIVEHRPYKSFSDFVSRVGSIVNRRAIEMLVRSGSMESIVPNTKWFLENSERVLSMSRKGKGPEADALIEGSRSEPDHPDEVLTRMAVEVCPLPVDLHPVQLFSGLMAKFGSHIQFQPLDSLDWVGGSAYIRGQIIDIRYNQVGDFHTKVPDELEKARIGWGKRYSNYNLEDETHVHWRIKLDTDIFEEFREIVDRGVGVCIAAKVSLNNKTKTIRTQFMIDLERMEQKMASGAELSQYEKFFLNDPLEVIGKQKLDNFDELWNNPAKRAAVAKVQLDYKTNPNPTIKPKDESFHVYGMITDCRKHEAKNGMMAFITIQGRSGGAINVICFNDIYKVHDAHIKRGAVLVLKLIKQMDKNYGATYIAQDVKFIDWGLASQADIEEAQRK